MAEDDDDEFLIWVCRMPDGDESWIIADLPDVGAFPLFGDEETVAGYAERAKDVAMRAGGVAVLARYRRVPHL